MLKDRPELLPAMALTGAGSSAWKAWYSAQILSWLRGATQERRWWRERDVAFPHVVSLFRTLGEGE